MLNKSIQLSSVLETCFLSPIKIEMYFYMPNTQRRNVQWQHGVWGMRGVFVPANKYVHAIFCCSKIRYLGQGVRSFLVGLSGESCFVLLSSVWDKWKTFWLSLQGESASREELWAMLRRMQDASNGEKKRREGKTLIKQFLLIIILFGFLFLFRVEEPACHLSRGGFDTAPLATVSYCCMLLSLFSVNFLWSHNVVYLPVEIIIIAVAYFHQCFSVKSVWDLKACSFHLDNELCSCLFIRLVTQTVPGGVG